MKGYLVLICLVGISYGAPQNWPRREGALNTHVRYVHPPKTNYRYLPQLEDDDEEVAVGRQETVGVVQNPTVLPPLVVSPETAAPVAVEPTKEAPVVPAGPPVSRPVAPPQNIGTGPQRPPFPPRPPPPPKDEEEDEDEEDDDETEEADDDDDEDDDDENEAEDEDEEEEERKRQEVTSPKKDVVLPAPAHKPLVPKPSAPAPVVVSPPVDSSSSVEDVNVIPSVESNEVETPVGSSGESLEQLEDGMEALVPGYITDQGEVLVPVDTVSGDQHISIVPDPYTRERHGSSFNNYRSHPFYYQDAGQDYFGF